MQVSNRLARVRPAVGYQPPAAAQAFLPGDDGQHAAGQYALEHLRRYHEAPPILHCNVDVYIVIQDSAAVKPRLQRRRAVMLE